MSSARAWPYGIGIAITLVFGFCVATIIVTDSSNIQESRAYMQKYQVADLNANELIKSKISFDALYNIEYITKEIGGNAPVVSYKITTKDGQSVTNAVVIVAISRPETAEFDKRVENPKVEDGVYSFTLNEFPKAGVWNFIAKVTVDGDERFYNIKADTRSSNAYEY